MSCPILWLVESHLAHRAAHNDNLSIHEDKARGVYVKGLTDVYVGSENEVYKVMQAGGASRAVSATSRLILNAHTGLMKLT